MKPLQITLFLIANVIFITQAARDVHLLWFGTEPSVLDRFSPEKERARAEKQVSALLAEYQSLDDEVRALEKGKKSSDVSDGRQEHHQLYERKEAIASEINERERRVRELRDLWLFSAFAVALIIAGMVLYRTSAVWPGFSLLVTGFGILEYWSSPTFFGGAVVEFHSLLVSKTILTAVALMLLYIFWQIKEPPKPPPEPAPSNQGASA